MHHSGDSPSAAPTPSPAAPTHPASPATTDEHIALAERYAAHNYHPLPVVVSAAEGCWVTDVDGRRYLDFLGAYSALNFGHRHPRIIAAAREQLDRLTLTSRAFHSDQFAPFCAELADLAGKAMVLPMNTGAEAVETGLKLARKWGYEVKGVPDGMANVVVAHGNFHGRTISIVSFSDDPDARAHFGPFTPGFRAVPYGDAATLAATIDEHTVAVLIEPIQGEAGVIVPPPGYLAEVRRICTERRVLFVADEIQTGLGRTGATFACAHAGVEPDVYLLGKALGGGVVPLSAVVGDAEVLGRLRPGQHGSTFGGNPLACAIGRTVVALLRDGTYQARARELGERLHADLGRLVGSGVVAVRGVGLWAGVDIDPALGTGRDVSEGMARRGVLAKETHGATIRLAPPLVVQPDEIDTAVTALADTLSALTA